MLALFPMRELWMLASLTSQFEERDIRKKKLEDSVVVEYVTTRYWLKWDGERTAKEMLHLV